MEGENDRKCIDVWVTTQHQYNPKNPKHPTYPHKMEGFRQSRGKASWVPPIADEGTGQMQARVVAQRGQISASETRLVAGSDERPKRWKAIKRAQSTPYQRNKACHKQINQKICPRKKDINSILHVCSQDLEFLVLQTSNLDA